MTNISVLSVHTRQPRAFAPAKRSHLVRLFIGSLADRLNFHAQDFDFADRKADLYMSVYKYSFITTHVCCSKKHTFARRLPNFNRQGLIRTWLRTGYRMILPERKQIKHTPIFRIGLFIADANGNTYDCLIRTMCEKGCLIEAIQRTEIEFWGRIVCDQIYLDRECRVVWRDDARFELKFTDCSRSSNMTVLRELAVRRLN